MVLVPVLLVLWRVQLCGEGGVHELNGSWTGPHPVLTLEGTVPLVPPTTLMLPAVIEPPPVTFNDDELVELLTTPQLTLTVWAIDRDSGARAIRCDNRYSVRSCCRSRPTP